MSLHFLDQLASHKQVKFVDLVLRRPPFRLHSLIYNEGYILFERSKDFSQLLIVFIENIEFVKCRSLELIADALGWISSNFNVVGRAPNPITLRIFVNWITSLFTLFDEEYEIQALFSLKHIKVGNAAFFSVVMPRVLIKEQVSLLF